METYSKEEIKHIKSQEWDKGWRCGLLVATILWIVIIAIVKLFFYFNSF